MNGRDSESSFAFAPLTSRSAVESAEGGYGGFALCGEKYIPPNPPSAEGEAKT